MSNYPNGLSLVHPPNKNHCKYDIVFVHGLNGDPYDTWFSSKSNYYWPKLISDNLNTARVWTLGYEIKASSWQGHTMPLYDRAMNTLEWLITNLKSEKPIVFIGHSFGGLLIKQILKNAHTSTNTKHNKILERTRGVIFVSTPHAGSDLAGYLDSISFFVKSTITIKELKPHNSYLRELNDWYRNNSLKLEISTLVFFETKKTNNLLVINPDTGNPGISGVYAIPVDEDHISICKIESPRSLVHLKSIDFIKELFKKKVQDQLNFTTKELQ